MASIALCSGVLPSLFLELIIPESSDGKRPSAAQVGFLSYAEAEHILPFIIAVINLIIDESKKSFGQDFSKLKHNEQAEIIKKFKRSHFRNYIRLTTYVIDCYYQNDDVLRAIGLDPRPPFPDGYNVDEGDIMLLEPVFLRGKIYRD
mgnify:CR=1 FL=1